MNTETKLREVFAFAEECPKCAKSGKKAPLVKSLDDDPFSDPSGRQQKTTVYTCSFCPGRFEVRDFDAVEIEKVLPLGEILLLNPEGEEGSAAWVPFKEGTQERRLFEALEENTDGVSAKDLGAATGIHWNTVKKIMRTIETLASVEIVEEDGLFKMERIDG